METIKLCTNLEQSKQLAEILPPESADMCWTNHYYGVMRSSMTISTKTVDEYKSLLDRFNDSTSIDVFYPAWSLAALLAVLNFPSLTQNKEDEWEVCVIDINNDEYIEMTASNPIDACVEMIIKLHKQKLL